MRGEHWVKLLSLSGSALSAAVSHLGQEATAPAETMTRAGLDGGTSEGTRGESDSWAER